MLVLLNEWNRDVASTTGPLGLLRASLLGREGLRKAQQILRNHADRTSAWAINVSDQEERDTAAQVAPHARRTRHDQNFHSRGLKSGRWSSFLEEKRLQLLLSDGIGDLSKCI